jgi:DtxR family transcriptional regulator, Mn-dependent transcriptional regulator
MSDINLSSSMEDYIKTIYILENLNKVARVSDIGRRLSVKKASVVAAVSFLQKNELIKHERYGFITLTETGRTIAANIERKNKMIFEFLSQLLKTDPEKAKNEACLMEHSLSDETAGRLAVFIKHNKPAAAKKTGKKHR